MIKFIHYINEVDECPIDLVLKNCKPFLKAIRNDPVKFPLYRGMKGYPGRFVKKSVRKDRKPRDMKKNVHNILDELFYEKFRIKGRSQCIFASGDELVVKVYGRVHYIFPIGNFKYLWSLDVWDLFDHMRDKLKTIKDEEKLTEYLQSLVDTYQKTNLKNGIRFLKEIMIDCKEYYAIKKYGFEETDFLQQLAKNI